MAETRTLRLTAANFADELPGLVGWTVEGGEELGPIVSGRVTWDGFDNARITGELDSDILGLPQTITVTRD